MRALGVVREVGAARKPVCGVTSTGSFSAQMARWWQETAEMHARSGNAYGEAEARRHVAHFERLAKLEAGPGPSTGEGFIG